MKHKRAIEHLRANGFAAAADDLERLDELVEYAQRADFWAAVHDGRLQTDYQHATMTTEYLDEDGAAETVTYPGVKLPEKDDS